MDSFELNKITGAVLGTLLFVMGAGFLAEAIYQPIEGRGPGYALPEPEEAAGGETAEAEPEIPLGVLLASADPERGLAAVRKCQSCHNFGEGEPHKQGPNLFNIVGASKAHAADFAYSDILIQQKAEGQTWTYDNLDAFLTNPKAYAPGTKMAFPGVRSPEERADILAYLQTLSANPVPFPAADAAPEAGAAETGETETGETETGEAAGGEAASQDTTDQDATGQDTTGQDATGQDTTGEDTTGEEPAAPASH